MRLLVLIPAYNEEGSIADVLTLLPRTIEPDFEIIPLVIDDGSTDATAMIAEECGAIVVAHPRRLGLAAAFRTGLSRALLEHADLIATLDADSQYRSEELSLLIARMRETGADLVVGDRQVRLLAHMPWKHRIGNMIGSAMLRLLRCTHITDASSGFRLFTADMARAIRITSVHTYTHEMLIQAKAFGFAVAEVPVTFLPRKYGKSKLIRTLRHHILRSCGTIVRAYLRTSDSIGGKRVLFVTRSLQRRPGGMQSYAHTLLCALRHRSEISLVVLGYGGGRLGLFFFLPYAWVRSLFSRADIVHFGDAVSALFLPLLQFFRPNLRVTVTVYGLDLTYDSSFYRFLLRRSLPHAHQIVAISRATALAAECLGVSKEKIIVLPCAVLIPRPLLRCGVEGETRNILLLGRQIRRKGTAWFLENVFPMSLRENLQIHCTIAGDGPEMPTIRRIIREKNLEPFVSILGDVSEEMKQRLYATSTLFLLPSIPIAGDMEGFGLVCIEASSHGLPVVAAKLEGISESVIDGVTGLFFQVQNGEDCLRIIKEALSKKWQKEAMHEVCRQKFSPDVLASSYIEDVWN